MQSDESIPLDKSFTVSVGMQVQEELAGPGTRAKGRFFRNLDIDDKFNCLWRRKCVVQMKNSDNLCVSRSLCILKAKDERDPAYRTLINQGNTESMGKKGLKWRAIQLQRQAGLDADKPVLIEDLWRFEEVLKTQILIVDAQLGCTITYGGKEERDKKFFLFKVGTHIHPIVNLGAFFNQGKFCTSCLTPYRPDSIHRLDPSC